MSAILASHENIREGLLETWGTVLQSSVEMVSDSRGKPCLDGDSLMVSPMIG